MPADDPTRSSGPLAGKVAIVTGASRGLGAAIAAGLAADGARTILWYRNDSEGARSVVEEIEAGGGSAASRRVDVTARAEVERAVAELVDEEGRVDILVNNAGIMRRAPFLEISDSDWDAVIDTNLTAYFIVSQLVGRVMAAQGTGSIVHVSSTNDLIASGDCTAYAAAKGGVGMLNRQLALELGPLGIRSNAVSPGMVETDLNRAQLADGPFRKAALDRIPLGRFVQPADVAGAVRYLASDLARSVNGTTVRVDAGRTVA